LTNYQVKLQHTGQPSVTFQCRPDQTILQAAYDNGYLLSSTCLRGGCGACRAQLIEGTIAELAPMSRFHCQDPVSGEFKYRLLCVASVASDVVIETDRPWQTRRKNPLSARLPG
jgi:ferredoxin